MLYNVTKVYVLNNEILYVDEGSISRDSSNYNQIDVITNVTGYGVEIAFELPNGVFSNRFGMTQNVGTTTVPSGISQLSEYEGEEWSSYTLLIPTAVLSAITSTTSQTLGFSLRFSKVLNEGEDNEYTQAYTTETAQLSVQGTIGGEPVALDPAWYQNEIVSDLNNLISIYNALLSLVTDSEEGLAQKLNKTGDTMTGTLTFAPGNTTRIVLNNNDVTMDDDAQINATSFSNGDYVSDAVKFSDLTSLFDLGTVTPGSEENFLTAYSNALEDKFNQYIKALDIGQTVVLTDGTSTMTGNLDMGGKSITNVLNVDGVDVSSLSNVVSGLSSTVQALQGSFVFRGIINNTTDEVNTDTSLLTTRLVELLERQPATGDVLKDSDGGEWYYDGSAWRFVGQGIIDTSIFATKTELQTVEGQLTPDAEANVQSDWNEDDDQSDAHILNKPSIFEQDELTPQKEDVENPGTFIPDFDTEGVLDERYYTEQELDNGQLDTRYYTEGQVDALLADKVNLDDLQTTLTLYATSFNPSGGDEIANYTDYRLIVTSQDDPNYDENFVELYTTDDFTSSGTSIITSNDPNNPTVVGRLITEPGIVDVIGANQTITTVGQVRREGVFFPPSARLRFKIYKAASDGTTTFITESGYTDSITNSDYENVFEIAVTDTETTFNETDRIAIEYEAYGPNAVIGIKFGGVDPARTVIPKTFDATINASNVIYDDTDNVQFTGGNVQSALDSIETALGTKPTLVNGLIPADLIPFQFNDVLQYTDFASFPQPGDEVEPEEGKLYIDISTNDIYRWDGSQYVIVKEAVGALGDIPNVTLTTPQTDDLLKYNGSIWVNGKIDVNELEDVVITGVQEGQYLKWDADAIEPGVGAWVNTALDAPVIDSLDAIDDVDASTPINGSILQYNATSEKWEQNRINFVSDSAPTNPYEGDLWFDSSSLVLYVYYNDGDSTQWVNAVSGIVEGQPEALNDLTDVNLSTLSDGEVLSYNDSTQVFENKKIVDYYTVTIATGDWSGTDPVTAVKTVSGILSTDKPLIDIDLSSVAFGDIETTQTEYAKLYRVNATADNEITFYALEAPTENLTIQIKVVR